MLARLHTLPCNGRGALGALYWNETVRGAVQAPGFSALVGSPMAPPPSPPGPSGLPPLERPVPASPLRLADGDVLAAEFGPTSLDESMSLLEFEEQATRPKVDTAYNAALRFQVPLIDRPRKVSGTVTKREGTKRSSKGGSWLPLHETDATQG
jgi:hypothetical protein